MTQLFALVTPSCKSLSNNGIPSKICNRGRILNTLQTEKIVKNIIHNNNNNTDNNNTAEENLVVNSLIVGTWKFDVFEPSIFALEASLMRKYLFQEHQISAVQLSADSSWVNINNYY